MQNRRARIIIGVPSFLFNPQRQIQIFAVHKKRFVQKARLLQRRSPHQHRRADDGIHLRGFVFIQIREIVLTKTLRARKQFGKPQHAIERHLRRGKTAATREVERTVAQRQFGADDARVGMRVEKSHQTR